MIDAFSEMKTGGKGPVIAQNGSVATHSVVLAHKSRGLLSNSSNPKHTEVTEKDVLESNLK